VGIWGTLVVYLMALFKKAPQEGERHEQERA